MSNAAYAGPEAFKQAVRRYTTVTIGNLVFRIRSLTERERSELELASLDDKCEIDREAIKVERARIIIAHVVNDDGLLVMNDDHVDSIMDADSYLTSTLAEECRRFSGIGRKASEAVAGISAKKNESETTAA